MDTAPERDVERLDVEAVDRDERQALYKSRERIFPKRVTGTFRSLKWVLMAITLGIYYITPWLRWDRGPNLPDQGVLIDIPARRFYFFFIEIWPQEFYYIAGILIMGGIGLFLVTSVVGRAWCGYSCWQTVWVDLFYLVERIIQGDRNARMKLDKAPWGGEKIAKMTATHAVFILVSIATGGAWIFYFADAPTLMQDFFLFRAPSVAYWTVIVLSSLTYIFGALMREQVCIYLCPWPRIQSAMLDEHSLVVSYHDYRGEPRTKSRKKDLAAGKEIGDCVDCNLCVAVCPMGIDIRKGLQLECITCALCIDACDEVMEKVGLRKGLISYDTHANMEKRGAGQETKSISWHFFRPRTLIYMGIWSSIAIALVVHLMLRDRLDLNVLRDRNPVFVTLKDGSIRNGYQIKILNMKPDARRFLLTFKGPQPARMAVAGDKAAPAESLEISVEPDRLRNVKIYVTIPRNQLKATSTNVTFTIHDLDGEETSGYTSVFRGPDK